MTTFKIGDKVRTSTHPREAVDGSPPQQPGEIGTVCDIGTGRDNANVVNVLRVRHHDGSEPWYRADDLIAIREVARRAGEETELERRVAKLEGRHNGLREAMAAELHGLEQRLDRLEGGEEEAPPVAEQLPVSVLQSYRALHRETAKWWREVHAEDPPEPEVSPTEQRIGDVLQTLAELDMAPDEPCPTKAPEPDDTAPETAETIRLLQERVQELEQSVAARGDRTPEWVEGVERMLNRLARETGTRGMWSAAVDRAIELRDQHDAITCRLRAIVPWDDAPSERNETAEELLDAVEGPAKLVLRLIDAFTPEQLAAVAAGIKAIAGEGDHISPATLVADLLEHLAGESS
jgi:hypothetical protein